MGRVKNPSRVRIISFTVMTVLFMLGALMGWILSGSSELGTLFGAVLLAVAGIALLGAYQSEGRYETKDLRTYAPLSYFAISGAGCAIVIALGGVLEPEYIPLTPIVVLLAIFIDQDMIIISSVVAALEIIIISEQNNVCVIIILLILVADMMLKSLKASDMYLRLLMSIIYMVISITGRILLAERTSDLDLKSITTIFVIAISESIIYMLLGPIVLKKANQQSYEYKHFLSLSSPLARQMKEKSELAYLHSLRVRRVCGKAAALIKVNEDLSKTAGFYYHLGHFFGEPEIDNGIKVANDYGMPTPVIDILSQYKGILEKPSTKESALVHICDSVITLAEEQKDADVANSGYMKLMIHTKLNELSETGIYDDSGLSINEFLHIKDMLASEELLK